MPIGSKLVAVLLCLCLTLAQANPSENRVARSSNDLYDWLTSLFDYDESEETLLCSNCTVVVNQVQRNGTDTTAAPVTAPPTAAPPTAAPPTAAPPTAAPPTAAPNGNNGAPNVAPTAATAAPTPPANPPPADASPATPAEG